MWPACASPAKPGEIVLPAIWPSRPIAISPDGNKNSPTLMQWAIRGHARDIRLDDLFLTGCAVGQRNEIDLDDSAHRGERLGRHNRHRTRDVGVVLVPRVETVGRVLDIGEVYLGLQRLLQR